MIETSQKSLHLRMAAQVRAIFERYADDLSAFVYELVTAAVDRVPGAQYAGITEIRGRGQVYTVAATGPYPAVLNALQRRCGQGPSLDAARSRQIVRVDDLASEARWPLFRSDAVARTPVRSLLSTVLPPDQNTGAALSLLAERPRAFTAEAVEVASVFASYAALAWGTVRANHQSGRAVASRDVIGQAKGILMERYGVTAEDAMSLLKQLASQSRSPLAVVARRLTDRPREQLSPSTLSGYGDERRQQIRDATRC